MNRRLFGSLFGLLHPPRSSTADDILLAALDRHTAATKDVVERAGKIDRALDNIRDASEGLFA